MTPQRPTFTQRGGDGAGFFYLLAAGGVAPPTLNFDFTTGSLPAGITFTRASIGTYVNNAGTLITAGNDVARLNYVAGVSNLLIEPSATNLLTQSNNFTHADWLVGNAPAITGAQFISPDGANNGWALTSGSGNGYLLQLYTYINTQYTISAWARQITGSAPIQLIMNVSVSGGISTTTTTTRFSYTATVAAGAVGAYIQVAMPTGSTAGIYGMQQETGSKMTSYIPTGATQVTRAPDSATFTIPAGVNALKYTFDDNSTQVVNVTPGSYTIPTNLSRANIKSIVSTFGYDFTSGSLPTGMTFSRASIGTYTNAAGTLITASNDVARFNYIAGVSNLLIEPSATNLLLSSNIFTSSWGLANGCVMTPAQFVSPDGTNVGWSWTSGGGSGGFSQNAPYTLAPYTVSAWVKFISGSVSAGFYWVIQGTNVGVGSLAATSTLIRYSGSRTADTAGSAPTHLRSLEGGGTSYGVYGMQLETGSIATSYIPTTTAAVTRAADNAVFTIPSGINQLVYTFDDNSTQTVSVTPGAYTIPTTLSRPNIKSIVGSA